MSALAIQLLVKDGKISLEDPVTKYLPQFRGWGARVKVKHLLYHTSGVPDYYEDIEQYYRKPNNSQALKYLKSLGYLDFKPGAKFDYSNSGYDTVGAIIQDGIQAEVRGFYGCAHLYPTWNDEHFCLQQCSASGK